MSQQTETMYIPQCEQWRRRTPAEPAPPDAMSSGLLSYSSPPASPRGPVGAATTLPLGLVGSSHLTRRERCTGLCLSA